MKSHATVLPSPVMHPDITKYNCAQSPVDRRICYVLAKCIDRCLPEAESKIWHAHPVWFLDGNPVVGYSKLKHCIRLLFWSGQSFDEPGLKNEGSFKAAEARYTDAKQIDVKDLERWLGKSRDIQWDYKNIVRRKGKLERLPLTTQPADDKPRHRIFTMKFADVYPLYVQKAQRKGRTQEEVDQIIRWLTGYTQAGVQKQIKQQHDFETFFAQAPAMHPSCVLIKGVVCGVRVENIEDPLMRKVRCLDKLIDELAKGKAMEKILRK